MNKKQVHAALDKKSGSVWFLILGVSLVTIYFNTQIEDPFNTPKLIILLILCGWILGHLVDSYKKNPIIYGTSAFTSFLLTLIFITSLFISTLFTDVKIVGFIGDTQRRNGWLAYFGLAIIMLYASRIMNFVYAMRLIKIAIFTGLILSSYGLLQVMGKDFIDWNNPYNSMIATVGNPNFASALLAILFLISLGGLFLKDLSIVYKIIGIFVLLASPYAILKSNSRQGVLTILFAMAFCITVYSFLKFKKTRYFIIPFTLLCSIFAVLGMLQKGPLSSILYKDSVSVRGYYWRAGIEMFRENPITGIGVDRYGAYFKQFREVSYSLKYGFDITSSNTHNTFIQFFATAGIVVGISYLSLNLYILYYGLKFVKSNNGENQKVVLALLSAWIGFQAQSLISIDNIGISVWGWLLGGAILGISQNLSENREIKATTVQSGNKVNINLLQPTASILALIPLIMLSFLLFNAEKQTYMVRAYAASDAPEAKNLLLASAGNVFDNQLADPYYKFKVSLALADAGYAEESYAMIKKLHLQDPRNLDYLKALAYFAAQRNDFETAIQSHIEITKFDPWNAANYIELGRRYTEIGNKEKAREIFLTVLDFAPNSEQANIAQMELDKL
jgi:O-antigen ligase